MKDWEIQNGKLFNHSNYKFVKPTPRQASAPFVLDRGKLWDTVIFWACLAGLTISVGLMFL